MEISLLGPTWLGLSACLVMYLVQGSKLRHGTDWDIPIGESVRAPVMVTADDRWQMARQGRQERKILPIIKILTMAHSGSMLSVKLRNFYRGRHSKKAVIIQTKSFWLLHEVHTQQKTFLFKFFPESKWKFHEASHKIVGQDSKKKKRD